MLKLLRPEQKTEIWRGWLKHYLEHRVEYPPAPEGNEASALLGWAFKLPDQLSELVDLLEALPGRGVSEQRLFWKLEKSELATSDPYDLARP